jgi:hypothetical protein
MADYNRNFNNPKVEYLSQENIEENSQSTAGLWSLVGKVLNLVKNEGLTPEVAAQRDAVAEKVGSFESSDFHQSFSIALMKDRLPK